MIGVWSLLIVEKKRKGMEEFGKWKLKTESYLNSEKESNRCRVVVVVEHFQICLIGEIYGVYGARDMCGP